jgi:hypothetical protein
MPGSWKRIVARESLVLFDVAIAAALLAFVVTSWQQRVRIEEAWRAYEEAQRSLAHIQPVLDDCIRDPGLKDLCPEELLQVEREAMRATSRFTEAHQFPWAELLGTFRSCILAIYGGLQLVRLTAWAVRAQRGG